MDLKIIEKDEKIEYIHGAYKIAIKDSYRGIYYSTAGGNCKLCHISDIVYSLQGNIDETISRLNELFSVQQKLCFEVNITDLKYIELLNKYFRLVFCNKVPIGYGGKYTYFALFLTNNNFRSSDITQDRVMERLQDEKEEIDSFKYECQYNNKI